MSSAFLKKGLIFWVLLAYPCTAVPFTTFSFDSLISDGANVSGTVTGQIFGLVDNLSDQPATQIVITSFPAGLTGTPALIPTSYPLIFFNRFTVVNGVVTSNFIFHAFDTATNGEFQLDRAGGGSALSFDGNVYALTRNGATFGPLNAGNTSAPEIDSTSAVVPLMFTFFGVLLHRRRHRAS